MPETKNLCTGCGCPALYRTSDPELCKTYPFQRLQGLYRPVEKGIWASSLKAAQAEFERFKQTWSQYPGAVDVWVRNWQHVEQLFNYGSAVHKVLYTTNSIHICSDSKKSACLFPGNFHLPDLRDTIAAYIRLSVEDGDLDGDSRQESNSIVHQRMLIHEFIQSRTEFQDCRIQEFCDDGYSGTNFDRPGFQEMMAMVKAKRIGCIIVKDDCVILELNTESPQRCGFCGVGSVF